MTIRTKALVVREYTVGESDKYITLFTKELGKIEVLAPKAKKTNQGLASVTQLFVYGDFMVVHGRNTYRLISAEIIEMFHAIREDLTALSYASYIMEFVQSVIEPELQQQELLKLTLVTLKAISKKEMPCRLIRRIFELRALSEMGFMPQVLNCVDCGEKLEEGPKAVYYFSVSEGGVLCPKCKRFYEALPINYTVLYTLQYILYMPFKSLYQFKITDEVLKVIEEIGDRFVAYYIDKSFKTIDFINRIEALS